MLKAAQVKIVKRLHTLLFSTIVECSGKKVLIVNSKSDLKCTPLLNEPKKFQLDSKTKDMREFNMIM